MVFLSARLEMPTSGAGFVHANVGVLQALGKPQHRGYSKTKISGRNINNLRYADDTTLMAERKQKELNSLLMKVKGENEKIKAQHSEN